MHNESLATKEIYGSTNAEKSGAESSRLSRRLEHQFGHYVDPDNPYFEIDFAIAFIGQNAYSFAVAKGNPYRSLILIRRRLFSIWIQ